MVLKYEDIWNAFPTKIKFTTAGNAKGYPLKCDIDFMSTIL